MPARAPASIDMFQTVMRSSMDMARIVEPRNSIEASVGAAPVVGMTWWSAVANVRSGRLTRRPRAASRAKALVEPSCKRCRSTYRRTCPPGPSATTCRDQIFSNIVRARVSITASVRATQNATRQAARRFTVTKDHLAVDERGAVADGAPDDPRGAPRKVAPVLPGARRHTVRIEHDEIGGESLAHAPTVPHAQEHRRLERQPPHRRLEGERALLPHPIPEQVARIGRLTDEGHVRATVGAADDDVGGLDHHPQRVLVTVLESDDAEIGPELLIERQIEHGGEPALPPPAPDGGPRLPQARAVSL